MTQSINPGLWLLLLILGSKHPQRLLFAGLAVNQDSFVVPSEKQLCPPKDQKHRLLGQIVQVSHMVCVLVSQPQTVQPTSCVAVNSLEQPQHTARLLEEFTNARLIFFFFNPATLAMPLFCWQ